MGGAVEGDAVSGAVWAQPRTARGVAGSGETSQPTVASPTPDKDEPEGEQGRGGCGGEEVPRRAPVERWMAPHLESARVPPWLCRSRSLRVHLPTPLTIILSYYR